MLLNINPACQIEFNYVYLMRFMGRLTVQSSKWPNVPGFCEHLDWYTVGTLYRFKALDQIYVGKSLDLVTV